MNKGVTESPIPQTPHSWQISAAAAALEADPERGLSEAEAIRRRGIHGPNELEQAPEEPTWRRFLRQFNELVIWVLLIAAIVSALLGEWPDALAILAIVVLNALLGFFQEERAERALAALQKLSAPAAKVIRDGELRLVAARELVPGDRIELEAGDYVPADARLIQAFGLRVQEAALTGESAPEDKDASAVLSPGTALGDRQNMTYFGTVVAGGKASALVVATGMHTELGRIAGMLQRSEREPTPLQRRLAEMGKVLSVACLALVALIFGLELIRGGRLAEVFLLSVSLAVAAIPEGLPAVVTIALAVGLQRMVRRNALVRRLPSVETLGSVTVICSDKTGTLTRNEMTVREIYAGGEHFAVTGAGFAPQGQFSLFGSDEPMDVAEVVRLRESPKSHDFGYRSIDPRSRPDLLSALETAARCNHAKVHPRKDGATWEVVGDPTEGALLVAALKGGFDPASRPQHLVSEIPFESERKAMSIIVRDAAGGLRMHTKGAPEVIVAKCVLERRNGIDVPLTDARREEILRIAGEMASRALRVLALATRQVPASAGPFEESGLTFAGLAGMIDPPREEAKEAVRKCLEAGIRPIMITGDHPATAVAIARELGIITGDDRAVTGRDLDAISDAELASQVDRISVYARVSAEHKLRVVRAWKARGQIVAMTGDGVNDAPAVKTADIGVAMGLSGTDVTKEASAMVLTDDNFASIVSAVEEGRGIYDNIQNVLFYLLSCNTGEILLILVAGVLGWPAPLVAIQLLWINLVTDGLPALALALERPDPGVMRRQPRPPSEPILTWRSGLRILFQGILVGGSALAAFAIVWDGNPDNVGHARTTAFCVLVYGELLRALAARSQTLTLAQLGLFTNPFVLGAIAVSALLQLSVVTLPFVRPVFEAVSHSMWEWLLLAVLALTPFTVIEVTKIIRARTQRRTDT